MKQYLDLLQRVLDTGKWQDNRTGIPTLRVEGAIMEFNLNDGFPAVTTKQLAFNQVKGELIGFIRGYSSAEQFRDLGCNIWNQNANENQMWLANPARCGKDDLGRIYGVQWRNWVKPYSCENVDQLANAIREVMFNPTSRRIIVSAWNPGELDLMSLPPCHMTYQFLVDVNTNELSLCMYQRSCDLFLGIPFNIASYALLLEIVAAATGRVANKLIMFLADVHIYKNHLEQVQEQLTRNPMVSPKLQINDNFFEVEIGMERLEASTPEMFKLTNYAHHLPIKGAMAV